MQENIKIEGLILAELRDKNGNLKETREVKNTITNTGFAQLAALAGNISSPAAFTYLAIGTDATAASASQTALLAESTTNGLGRASATVSRVTTTQTNDTLQLVKAFTCTGGTTAIAEVGIFNDATTGVMLGRQVFSVVNMTDTDVLTITYKVKFA